MAAGNSERTQPGWCRKLHLCHFPSSFSSRDVILLIFNTNISLFFYKRNTTLAHLSGDNPAQCHFLYEVYPHTPSAEFRVRGAPLWSLGLELGGRTRASPGP